MSLTKAEVFELLRKYSQEQILEGFQELHKIDPSFDPNAESFDEEIVERLEDTFSIIENAQTKALAAAPQGKPVDLAKIEQTAMEMAGDRIDMPPDTFRNFIEILVSEQVAKAVLVHDLKETIYQMVSSNLENSSLGELNQATADRIMKMRSLVANPEQLNEFIDQYQLPKATEGITEEGTFDASAYLQEVEEKKSFPPAVKTISDTRRLAQALLANRLVG